MEVVDLTYPIRREDVPHVLAIGDFDGVHLGHQQVLREACALGKEMGLPACVMTFRPHPREVLGNGQYREAITPHREKLERMNLLGVDKVFVVRFDSAFAAISPAEFVQGVLLPLGVRGVVVGFDFTFGAQGRGTIETLKELSRDRFRLRVVPPVHRGGEKVSSYRIRELLLKGEVEEAAQLLGRPYRLKGRVVHGFQRGRTMGFPTANLNLSEPYLLPRQGVYVVRGSGEALARPYTGVMNVGYNPTFEAEKVSPKLEAHLFDFSGDLYGRELTVEFLHYLREEVKFAHIDDLVRQIRQDAEQARLWLKEKGLA